MLCRAKSCLDLKRSLPPQKIPPDGEREHARNDDSKNHANALSSEKSEEQIGICALIVTALWACDRLRFAQLGRYIKEPALR